MKAPVLVVDDDPEVRESLRVRLTSAGFDVVTARDAESAMSRYEASRARVVLLDASMPGRSGFDFCEQIKERDGDAVAVVFVSGASAPTTNYVEQCARISRCDAFVRKPFDGRQIVELVRELIEKPVLHV